MWRNLGLIQLDRNSCITGNTVWKSNLYRDFTIICQKLENNNLNINCELLFKTKEQPKKETEKQQAIRKEWSSM